MISEGFVRNYATVYISSRDAKACEQACKELNALGKGKADFIAADFYSEEELKKVADELKKRAGSTSDFLSLATDLETDMLKQSSMSLSTTAAPTGASLTTRIPPLHGTAFSI